MRFENNALDYTEGVVARTEEGRKFIRKGEFVLRENDGKGVHFSGPGLRAHAACWVDKVAPWLEQCKHL